MKPNNIEDQELLMLPNRLLTENRMDVGPSGSRFYAEMKENKRIFATKCPDCGRLSIPARVYCGLCHGTKMTGWVEQGDKGILALATVQYYEFIHPRLGKAQKTPWASGLIKLDGGAEIAHYVYPPDPEKLVVGERYKAVWKEDGERVGGFHDILYFTRDEDQNSEKLIPDNQEPMAATAPHSLHGKIDVVYSKTAGAVGSKALVALRDDQRILGTRCRNCNKVYAPAASVCDDCFGKLDEFVELSGTGRISSFTIVHKPEVAHPIPTPFALAVIDLDGADTGMTHYIGGIDHDRIEIGMAVAPVFRKERVGSILDIAYFKPIA